MRLAGRKALVTGAGSGIGRATALLFAEEGAEVGVADIDLDAARRVVGEIEAAGGAALPIQFDVACSTAVGRGYGAFIDRFGALDISVHYAGMRASWPQIAFDETLPKNAQIPDDFWNGIVGSHLSGTYWCAREALAAMIPRQYGRIINCGSAIASVGYNANAAYIAAKMGIVGLTRALAADASQHGILVNCIAPGAVDTPRPGIGRLPDAVFDTVANRTPIRRWAEPRELAAVALFLASDDSSFVTGQLIGVNGGAAMAI
jgi:NAD(P)-dependent dehydrogenase (short-subunit alcohol dehydrogenase family)